jgi:hypothetical protein
MLMLTAAPAILIQPQPASACSKGTPTTAEYDYKLAHAVYSGIVTKLETVYYHGYPYRNATFETVKDYKGEPNPTHSVLTAMDSDQCGADFKVGSSYVVYSHVNNKFMGANVFGVFPLEPKSDRIKQLETLLAQQPIRHEVGMETIEAYVRSDLKLLYGRSLLTPESPPLVYEDSVYVPHTFFTNAFGLIAGWDAEARTVSYNASRRTDIQETSPIDAAAAVAYERSAQLPMPTQLQVRFVDIRMRLFGNPVSQWILEPFLYRPSGEQNVRVYVPLRDTAERLGFKVIWQNPDTVHLETPILINSASLPKLAMKLSVNNGKDADLLVDSLDNDTVIYRLFDYLNSSEPETSRREATFTDLIKMREGIQQHVVRLFYQVGNQELEFKLSEELIQRIEMDAYFRRKLGASLGQSLRSMPKDGVLRSNHLLSDLEADE